MLSYVIRRLVLLPLTLFCIILVNFVIINLAPGDPVTVTEISQEGGATRKEGKSVAFGSDDRYLQFREHYGLTLPILYNDWPWITQEEVIATLKRLVTHRYLPGDAQEMEVKAYDQIRLLFGDQARFVMRHLIALIKEERAAEIRQMAVRFFIRGGTYQAFLGPTLTEEQKAYNRKVSKDNTLLRSLELSSVDSSEQRAKKIETLASWYEENKDFYNYEPSMGSKIKQFFFSTRFCRYMGRVLTLDFGTLRNDSNKTVISEVTKRFKYSLTLALLPMLITFVFCQVFGFTMALNQDRWPDYSLNVIFLILYATPVFVVAPFLIEMVGLNHHFPFTDIPIPISGFTSQDSLYAAMTTKEKLFDVLQHIALPLVAVIYGGLASEARLSRTAVLEVMRQDYVRTARAKGLDPLTINLKHVGRNAAITIVTSIAGSLGVVLGGSLIVETLFDINGFGKFFYDAVINRDYNVIMFSALAGAFLTLVGYLIADMTYTVLDPRVTLE